MQKLIVSATALASLITTATAQTHTLRFYIEPWLAPDPAFARTALTKFVGDANTILAANTTRQFAFDPQSGITVTTVQPGDGIVPAGGLPLTGFEIWAHVIATVSSGSGAAIVDSRTGAGVLSRLGWRQIYDPSLLGLGSEDLQDYTRQLTTFLHEFGHVAGVAGNINEYYMQATCTDRSGVSPIVNVDLSLGSGDVFWGAHTEFFGDPMLQYTHPYTRWELLQSVRFSPLSAAILCGSYRLPTAMPPMANATGLTDTNSIQLQVFGPELTPLTGARVRIFRPRSGVQIADTFTDAAGRVAWRWQIEPGNNFTGDFFRLIKIYHAGFEPAVQYVSTLDLQSAAVLGGLNTFNHTISLKRLPSRDR